MYLSKGDKIGIMSPSRFIEPEALEPAVNLLEQSGFEVVLATHVYERNHQFAGSDAHKISDLRGFIRDPEIKAILASRGGYGSVRITDHIDFSPLEKDFKWMCGYSDFTAFHSALHQAGIPSIHSTMPINIKDMSLHHPSFQTLLDALCGKDLNYELRDRELNKNGSCEGVLVGGNLSMLYSLLGSGTQINTKGKILFMEDLDEYLYHIDRMMMALKRAGMIQDLAGLIVGGMSEMNDNKVPYGKTAEEIIHEHCVEFGYPMYFGFDAGHIEPNLALRLGKKAIVRDNQLFLQA